MNRVRVQISGELIRQLLHLPLSAAVVGSRHSSSDVEIVIESPDVPELSEYALENDLPPLASPTFTIQPETVTLVAWNVLEDA